VGALGKSSMAWSQIVCWGRRCDSCLLNTFLCRMYSIGIAGSSSFTAELIVTCPMKYWSWYTGRGAFIVLGRNRAFFAFGVTAPSIYQVFTQLSTT